jgi:hypothetical protein
MKKFLAIALLSAAPVLTQAAPATPAADPLAPIAWMAGGTWHGEVNGPDGKPTKIDTRIERELAGKAFTFSTKFNGVEQYQGYFAYDAAKKALVFSYPSADGGIASGSVAQVGDSQVWDLSMTEATGSVGHFQVRTHQTGADDYTWALFQPQGDSWTKLFEIHYHRTKD